MLNFTTDSINPVAVNNTDTVPPVTGLNNVAPNSVSLLLYPNPAHDVLHVETNDRSGIQSLHIYDLNGQMIEEIITNTSGKQEVNISKFKPGIYFMQVITATGSGYRKFCVE